MNRNPGRDSGPDQGGLGSLNDRLEEAGLNSLNPETTARFDRYLSLLLKWNARMNLTAIRDPKEILSRHFLESITCAQALPPGIATLLDFGSGAGFPGIPIALCRPEILVTLAESQTKKAAFLQEAVRTLGLSARVFSGRAERLDEQFDCVALRAVDRMEEAIAAASQLLRIGGWLAVLTTRADLAILEKAGVDWLSGQIVAIAGSEQRVVALVPKAKPAA